MRLNTSKNLTTNEEKHHKWTGRVRVCFVFMSDRRRRGIDRFGPAIVHPAGTHCAFRSPSPIIFPPALHLRPQCAALHVHTSFEYAQHPRRRVSRPPLSPIMCKLYYFYPKYISPPCAAPRHGLRGQQVKLHMSIVSHPPVSQRATPPLRVPAYPAAPYLFTRRAGPFSESHVCIRARCPPSPSLLPFSSRTARKK